MELSEKLAICKVCRLGKFIDSKGIVCSLTENKPTFEETCPDFKEDLEKIKRIESTQVKKELSKSFPKGAIVGSLALIGYVIIRTILGNL